MGAGSVTFRGKALTRPAQQLFGEHRDTILRRTDRMFVWLMLGQWVFGITVAVVLSPYAWAGRTATVHFHVYVAVLLGAALSSNPIALALLRPGAVSTRHVIAVSQMSWGAVLIHLTGGRIETHFHVFGSLAILAFYRDVRVLVTASLVVVVDHFVRGLYWPESVYGVSSAEWWRFLEHGFWVVCEVAFLAMGITASLDEMREIAQRRAEQKQANAKLSVANTFLDSLVENLPTMIFLKDAEHLRFERINQAGEVLLSLSREELLGKDDFDLFPKEQAEFFQQKDRETLEHKKLVDVPSEPISTAGGRRWLHTKKIPILNDQGVATHLLGISEDITARKEAADALARSTADLQKRVHERTDELVKANEALRSSEAQLQQAQKMEAMGILAGGVAHDFNNLLSVVLSYGQFLAEDMKEGDPMRADLEEIRSAGRRAADLTKQLLAFSRKQVLQPQIVDLHAIIAEMQNMLRRLLGEDVELLVPGAGMLPKILVDPGQMQQVIMNLAVNARDAMPRGGRLTIDTSEVLVDERSAAERAGTAGRHVKVSVSDNGKGMDAATRARIFEPFFTTKEVGRGTGLGLATVFGIVRQSGGTISVTSAPDRGTTFDLYFPVATTAAATAESLPPPSGRSLRGSETILLVEDEERVRVLARTILRRYGYDVIEAQNGGDAFLICEQHTDPIDLLLTDVVMPRMSGRQLAERLLVMRPKMKVLYMSGYTDDRVVRHGVQDSSLAFIQKPITPEPLVRKVREVLG